MYKEEKWRNPLIEHRFEVRTVPAISNGNRGRPSGGFIIGWNHSLASFIKILNHLRSAVFLEIFLEDIPILIVFLYISPDRDFRKNLNVVFEVTLAYMNHYKSVLVLVDANSRLGQYNSVLGGTRSSKDTTFNNNGKGLLGWANELGLLVGNGALNGDREGEVTYISDSNHGTSVIDLLLYSSPMSNYISSFNVLDLTHSAHFPILTILNQEQNESVAKPPEVLRIPDKPDELDRLKTNINQELDSVCHTLDPNSFASNITDSIISSAKSSGFFKPVVPKTYRARWFDSECITAKYNMKNALRHMRKLATANSPRLNLAIDRFTALKQSYNQICTEKQQDHESRLQGKLHNLKSPSEFWDAVKQTKNPRCQPSNKISSEKWVKHYWICFRPRTQI